MDLYRGEFSLPLRSSQEHKREGAALDSGGEDRRPSELSVTVKSGRRERDVDEIKVRKSVRVRTIKRKEDWNSLESRKEFNVTYRVVTKV